MENKWLFLSHVIKQDMFCYNGDKNIKIVPYKNQEIILSFKGHVGTHIDFPYHVYKEGKKSTDYCLSDFIYEKVAVVEVINNNEYIVPDNITGIDLNVECIIFNTGSSEKRNLDLYAYKNKGLHSDTAYFLKQNFPFLKAIGIDSISINAYENKEPGRVAHKVLLSEPEILIIEDLNLADLKNRKIKKMMVLPVVIENADFALCSVAAEVEHEI